MVLADGLASFGVYQTEVVQVLDLELLINRNSQAVRQNLNNTLTNKSYIVFNVDGDMSC